MRALCCQFAYGFGGAGELAALCTICVHCAANLKDRPPLGPVRAAVGSIGASRERRHGYRRRAGLEAPDRRGVDRSGCGDLPGHRPQRRHRGGSRSRGDRDPGQRRSSGGPRGSAPLAGPQPRGAGQPPGPSGRCDRADGAVVARVGAGRDRLGDVHSQGTPGGRAHDRAVPLLLATDQRRHRRGPDAGRGGGAGSSRADRGHSEAPSRGGGGLHHPLQHAAGERGRKGRPGAGRGQHRGDQARPPRSAGRSAARRGGCRGRPGRRRGQHRHRLRTGGARGPGGFHRREHGVVHRFDRKSVPGSTPTARPR